MLVPFYICNKYFKNISKIFHKRIIKIEFKETKKHGNNFKNHFISKIYILDN